MNTPFDGESTFSVRSERGSRGSAGILGEGISSEIVWFGAGDQRITERLGLAPAEYLGDSVARGSRSKRGTTLLPICELYTGDRARPGSVLAAYDRGEGVKEFLRIGYEEGCRYFDTQVIQAAGFDVTVSPEIDSVENALDATNRLNERYARMTGSS